ncbi:Spy/CpxP family protein refolding chaperone [Candidatus Sumerlaeota bacterium]|nr:Spy/CpxP family protein refolding chaperone [Candidatus Sumerlaeota bacterium]
MKPANRQMLLWLSLGLNVAFVVALVGVAFFPEASVRILATEARAAASIGAPDGKAPRHDDERGHGGDPMKRELNRIAKVIKLEPAQRQRIETMLDNCKNEGRNLYSQMKEERVRAFKTLLEEPNNDLVFSRVIDESHDIHEAMAFDILSRFRAMVRELTPEQREKLLKEFDQWESKDPPPPPPK